MASSSNPIAMATDASSSINADSTKNPTTSVQIPIEFVDEPDMQDEKAREWETQVLIPSPKAFTHAFLGPLPSILTEEAEVEVNAVFPSHHKFHARIFDDIPLHLECFATRVFRSVPKVEHPEYLAWLDKIQAKKGENWQQQGIFDLIQLSRYGPKYDTPLLLAALHFWDAASHSLHLKCGMLAPTLLDVAALTGLKPLGETFDPRFSDNTYGFDYDIDDASFNPFIDAHHVTNTAEVSDAEHLAFLTFWLSSFVFCSRSLQVAKAYIPLAIQLHEMRDINLAKLILGTLYQQLDNSALELKHDHPTTNFAMGGPIWLFQLWLLATFETKLNLIIPDMIMPSLEKRRTEGIRLAQMRNQEINIPVEDAFSSHYEMFLKCYTFTPSMAPFVKRTHGPAWFIREFPSASPEFAEETNQIWQAYLSPSLLSTRLTASKTKTSFGISRYFPSCLARQFGLCQLRPAPAVHHRGEFLCPTTETAYRRLFEKFRYRNLVFEPIPFNPKFACTKEFYDWWLEYYNTVSGGLSENDFLAKLLNAHLPTKEKKTKGMPNFDTYTFHEYFSITFL